MCHGYRSRWYRRFEEEEEPRQEPVTFVSDPEVREPVEPVAEDEPREPEKVLVGD